jgi:hypothetical protein
MLNQARNGPIDAITGDYLAGKPVLDYRSFNFQASSFKFEARPGILMLTSLLS